MTQLEHLQDAVIKPSDYQAPTVERGKSRFKITPVHCLLLLLGVLCLLFIAFISLARSVEVRTVTIDPNNTEQRLPQLADVAIDGWLKLPLANRFMLLSGEYPVSIEASGFVPIKDKLQVNDERVQQFEFVLQPLPGVLDIDLHPEIAAVVKLNNKVIGQLPDLITDVPAGLQTITIDAPLYREATQQLLIIGKGEQQSASFQLEPAWAELSLNSIPEGANVVVDGESLGQTPITLKLEEGSRKISLTASGYKPHERDIIVVAQQDLLINDIRLKPADGILNVQTQPESAAIIVDGEFVGVSPLSLALSSNEKHKLQVYKAGFVLHESELSLAPEQKEVSDLKLKPDLVAVKFSVTPSDAQIFVDGQSRGTGSQTLYLSALQHQIRIQKPGYASYQAQIIPTKANQQIVSVSLLTEEQQFWANIPDEYATSAGQAMRLFKSPGKVKMGSSRGEAGRRENEVRYSAQLSRHFYLGQYEVTNKQFRAFNAAHNAGNYKRKSLDSNNHPAVNISWQQAALYCNWLSKKEGYMPFYQTKSGYVSGVNVQADGYRLPTEVEWAWAARNKNQSIQVYPWGNESTINVESAGNFADTNAEGLIAFTLDGYSDGYIASAPVGRYSANHNGLFDLGGNVSEWINDWYSARGNLDAQDGMTDPLGPDVGEFHVIRGGSWAKGYLPQLRLAYRDFGAKGKHDVGFRLARYAGPVR